MTQSAFSRLIRSNCEDHITQSAFSRLIRSDCEDHMTQSAFSRLIDTDDSVFIELWRRTCQRTVLQRWGGSTTRLSFTNGCSYLAKFRVLVMGGNTAL